MDESPADGGEAECEQFAAEGARPWRRCGAAPRSGLVRRDLMDRRAEASHHPPRLFMPPARHQIGRAHACTPVTNAPLVCRLLLEQNNILNTTLINTQIAH